MTDEPTAPVPVSDGGIPLATSAVNAQTVFADVVWFAANLGQVVRITFLENILEPEGSLTPGLKARHVGTLVIPRQGFEGMVDYLNERRELFRKLDAEAANAAK